MFEIAESKVEDFLPLFPDNYFDACLCDPPYLLQFMGKEFDKQHKKEKGQNEGQKMQAWHERWTREVLRVLKPGAHMLAFGGTRTYHRLVSAAEDVGFEVKDMLTWLHGQGFPKNKDTQLKPAVEPCALVKKPGSVGRLNIDSCRIGTDGGCRYDGPSVIGDASRVLGSKSVDSVRSPVVSGLGRWPANLLLSHHSDCEHVGERRVKANQTSKPGSGKGYENTENKGIYGKGKGGVAKASTADADGMETVEVWECHSDCPVRVLDEQSGILKSPAPYRRATGSNKQGVYSPIRSRDGEILQSYGDIGGASRFFYCAKVSTRERNLGGIDCRHPTLKPISLPPLNILPPPYVSRET